MGVGVISKQSNQKEKSWKVHQGDFRIARITWSHTTLHTSRLEHIYVH
jgi:hypothetical protein